MEQGIMNEEGGREEGGKIEMGNAKYEKVSFSSIRISSLGFRFWGLELGIWNLDFGKTKAPVLQELL